MKKILLILAAVLLLSACMTMHTTKGTKIDESVLPKIEKGKTTKSQIRDWFGYPDRVIGVGVRGEFLSDLEQSSKLIQDLGVVVRQNQELYIYELTDTRGVKGIFLWWGSLNSRRQKTLRVWIDKDTGIVQDFEYTQEQK